MTSWLSRLFHSASPRESSSQLSGLELQNQIAQLRLDLQDRDTEIKRLRSDLTRAQEQMDRRVTVEVQNATARLMDDLAPFVAQSVLQRHLVEVEQKDLQIADLLSVPARIQQVLEKYGLEVLGKCGEQASYDPSIHMPLSSSTQITPGQSIRLRFIGIAYQGKILRKAGVESVE
jgi:molecular chaperone GrpE (heat shock protein)